METHLKRNDMPTRAQRFDVTVPADIWIPNQDEFITPPSRKNVGFGGFISTSRKGTKFSLKEFVASVANATISAVNGLTESLGTVKLGGSLTENTTITGTTYDLAVTTSTGDITFTTTNSAGSIDLTSAGAIDITSSQSLFVTAPSNQATFGGHTTFISTSSPTGLDINVTANDGVLIRAEGVVGSNTNVDIESAVGDITLTAAGNINMALACIPTYADDTAAGVGGLTAGELYKTATGSLQIKL